MQLKRPSASTLVFTTCYNERENIGPLIDEIAATVPDADLLVVDDNSPDGTWSVLEEKRRLYPHLTCVQRPRKLGIGSAHKYALYYAMREGYATLVTMDADFSHRPSDIPALLAHHGPGTFVTGSRYCAGGSSDYKGYRNLVSRIGNFAARHALGVRLRELTTYFRVFDVTSLRALPLRRITASGYSYGVELIHYLHRAGIELREVPIHFADRTQGASKIPRMQILWSALDLARIALRRALGGDNAEPDPPLADACPNCGDRALALRHFGSARAGDAAASAATYRCTAVGDRRYPPVCTCLRCGLVQVPAAAVPARLETYYEDVEDAAYVANARARQRTFQACFDALAPHLPPTGTLLEIGSYTGLFLVEAGRRGWQAEGVEPSRWAAARANETGGVRVHQGFLSDARPHLRKRYDVVATFDVLEHVRDPAAFLRDCASLLGPGGVLCFSTLDAGARFARAMGTRWPWLMEMHLFYFDRATTADLLRRNGFELVAARPYAHYARVRYAIEGLAAALPAFPAALLRAMGRAVPDGAMIRVALGDIMLYVARRMPDPTP